MPGVVNKYRGRKLKKKKSKKTSKEAEAKRRSVFEKARAHQAERSVSRADMADEKISFTYVDCVRTPTQMHAKFEVKVRCG